VSSTPAARGDPLLRTEDIRRVEAAHSHLDLMRRAGKGAAEFLVARTTPESRIVLFVGPGNNGGDALSCAAELAAVGYAPEVVLLSNPEKLPPDARAAWLRVVELQKSSLSSSFTPSPLAGEGWGEGEGSAEINRDSSNHRTPHPSPLPQGERGQVIVTRTLPLSIRANWIIDGLFGIGLKRPLDKAYGDAVHAIEQAREDGAKVLALDVPSGIDADTGALVGEIAIIADHTLTFIARKPGLMTGAALDYVGELHLASLGLDLCDTATAVITFGLDDARALMRPARANTHKGTNGTLTIIGGANGMLGAALLASRAAMRMGAGKVKVAWLANPHPQVDPQMPEVMMRSASDLTNDDCTALVIGCGMGTSGAAIRVLNAQLKRELPIVIDADALNLIAQSADLAVLVQQRKAPTVITPHPAEAARLLGASRSSVQADRLRAARDLAVGYSCVAVLKGAGTVVHDGTTTSISTTGNPLLATAGTGDVLAGMIGALLAQGYDAATAARLGVCLHGVAADAMRARGAKRAVAGDVIGELRFL
jgi:ADP-dependent NAD(P)H-hydrate dehydratase / NAD(P)H-hydrate epimerase